MHSGEKAMKSADFLKLIKDSNTMLTFEEQLTNNNN